MNELRNSLQPERQSRIAEWRSRPKLWAAAVVGIVAVGIAWLGYSASQSSPANSTGQAALPQVSVSQPLQRELDTRLSFVGQFSAVEQVELRAQVGGTLTGIYFKDGEIVEKGELLFTIDPTPYQIKLAEASAQLEIAMARLTLADRELHRAIVLQSSDAGTGENVDQRTSDERAAQASVDDANAELQDAQFDVDHCRITAPFNGRIGNHLVSVGNLIAGSRTAASPTTLLATLVSLEPIYVNFDMSQSDFITFSTYREGLQRAGNDKVDVSLDGEPQFTRQGVLDFVDNVLDPNSGTIHARAIVPNSDSFFTPGEFASVDVVVAPPTATLLVPDDAVLPDQSEHVVMTVSQAGIVVPKQVEIGDMRGGLRVIRSGLSPQDRIIIDGIPYATPGGKVAVQNGTINYNATLDEN